VLGHNRNDPLRRHIDGVTGVEAVGDLLAAIAVDLSLLEWLLARQVCTWRRHLGRDISDDFFGGRAQVRDPIGSTHARTEKAVVILCIGVARLSAMQWQHARRLWIAPPAR
jgi:hypothetical protein